MLTSQLEQLLKWGVPKMTDEGAKRFQELLEAAIRNVVTQAFDPKELASFNVIRMTNNIMEKP